MSEAISRIILITALLYKKFIDEATEAGITSYVPKQVIDSCLQDSGVSE